MDKKPENDVKQLDILYNLFSVSAFGLNQRLSELVEEFLDKRGLRRLFTFYEFFSHQPLPKQWIINNPQNVDDNKIYFTAPFIPRIIENSLVMPEYELNGRTPKVSFYDAKRALTKSFFFLYEHTTFGKELYELWNTGKREKSSVFKEDVIDFNCDDQEIRFLYIKKYDPKAIRSYAKGDGITDEITRESRKTEVEYFRLAIPFNLDKKQNDFPMFVIPISCNELFYGEILFFMPLLCKEFYHRKDKLEVIKDLICHIHPYVKSVYAPALALMHNHFIEKNFRHGDEHIKLNFTNELNSTSGVGKFLVYNNVFQNNPDLSKSSDVFARSFSQIWNNRNNIYPKEVNAENEIKWKESLIFDKYVIASEQMIKTLKSAIEAAQIAKKSGKSQPSVLIVAPAGSGKEKIAKIISLFSTNYWNGDRYIINLASLRPRPITGPLMAGLELSMDAPAVSQISISGILDNVRNESFIKLFEKINKDLDEGLTEDKITGRIKNSSKNILSNENYFYSSYPTLILDEFNSLDVDSQGALLRYLEEGEIIPIGAVKNNIGNKLKSMSDKYVREHFNQNQLSREEIEKKKRSLEIIMDQCKKEIWDIITNCLVIGIMNEDPDDITQEKAMEFFKSSGYLGGILSDLLYEHFQNIRRLRPDVKYRMIRNGKIVLPSLKDRREDIPILFKLFVEEETTAKENTKRDKVKVSFDALRTLMGKEISWPGNIRQLQAVAKRAVERLDLEIRNTNSKEDIIIEKSIVLKALDEVMPIRIS
jgi:hypothetical protein